MDTHGFSIDEILRLCDKVAQAGLGSIEVREGDYRLKIEGSRPVVAAAPAAPAVAAAAEPVQTVPAAVPAIVETPAPAPVSGTPVTSPIVGTFYSAPAPDKAPFVKAGQAVKKGDVLFIIESMKLMNEVLCEEDGVVKEIVAKDGQAVEYGETILYME